MARHGQCAFSSRRRLWCFSVWRQAQSRAPCPDQSQTTCRREARRFGAPDRADLERITDNHSTLVFVYAAQEMADSSGISDSGVMLCLYWLEDFLEAVSRVEDDIAARAGKAADLPGGFGHFVRCYRMTCGLNRSDCTQNIGWHKFADGLFANPLIEQGNEPLLFLDIGRRVGILLCGTAMPEKEKRSALARIPQYP